MYLFQSRKTFGSPNPLERGNTRGTKAITCACPVLLSLLAGLFIAGCTLKTTTQVETPSVASYPTLEPLPSPIPTLQPGGYRPGTGDYPPTWAPEIVLDTNSGHEFILSEFKGQVVVLLFTSDMWLRMEGEALDALYRQYETSGVTFVGILDVGGSTVKEALPWGGSTRNRAFPLAFDGGYDTYRAYRISGIPTTWIVDRRGLLVKHWVGAADRVKMAGMIQDVLAEP